MRVEAIKIGEYDPEQNGRYSRYKGYCLSTKEEVDLPITEGAHEVFVDRHPITNVILHSTLLRAIQTVGCLPKTPEVKLIPLPQLREIPFKLEKLVSEEEFEREKSKLVRARFVEAFILNSLMQSREQIRDNIYYVIGVLKGLKGDEAVIVSHSFFMKILETFVNGIDVFGNPENIRQVINPDIKIYEFGKGFFFEI